MANSTGYSIGFISGPRNTGIQVIQGRSNTTHTFEGLITGDYSWRVNGIVFDSNNQNYVFTGENQTVSRSVACAPTATPTAVATATPTTAQATATPTSPPNDMRVAMSLIVPGVGSGAGGNTNPNPATRTFDVQAYDPSGAFVKGGTGQGVFDPASSSFKGTASLGTMVPGFYRIKVRFENTLWKAANGVNLVAGQTTTVPIMRLVSGDLNSDNQLNLLDYNTLLSCYGNKSCAQKTKADLNLDTKVDEADINILYTAFATREGD
jgi:hypothetical protein